MVAAQDDTGHRRSFMLRTRFTELFGLTYPVISAPMSGHASAPLAAAVSEAGGLGAFGAIDQRGPDWVRQQIEAVRAATDRPFAVGFITPFIPYLQGNLDVTLEARVPAMFFSFSDPAPYVARAKESGAVVICQVLDAHPETPVLAAGGIASGRALAAALAAGADGAVMGTAFLATPEAVDVVDLYKQRIVASDGHDTVWTRVHDLIDGLPWPDGIGGRLYANAFVREWDGRDDELVARREEFQAQMSAAFQKDVEKAAVYMGQSAAFVNAVRPAADVLRAVCDDAERILRERLSALGG
jgi:nitronate monooxygenase